MDQKALVASGKISRRQRATTSLLLVSVRLPVAPSLVALDAPCPLYRLPVPWNVVPTSTSRNTLRRGGAPLEPAPLLEPRSPGERVPTTGGRGRAGSSQSDAPTCRTEARISHLQARGA